MTENPHTPHALGEFDYETGKIRLRSDMPTWHKPWTLFHELCHLLIEKAFPPCVEEQGGGCDQQDYAGCARLRLRNRFNGWVDRYLHALI